MVALTINDLKKFSSTRTKQLHIEDITKLGYIITSSMYRKGKLVLVTTDTKQDSVYKGLAIDQRNSVISYYQQHYSNVSQYKCLGNSKGRFLVIEKEGIDLSEKPLVEVRLPSKGSPLC